jgi:hypothetical protein
MDTGTAWFFVSHFSPGQKMGYGIALIGYIHILQLHKYHLNSLIGPFIQIYTPQ